MQLVDSYKEKKATVIATVPVIDKDVDSY